MAKLYFSHEIHENNGSYEVLESNELAIGPHVLTAFGCSVPITVSGGRQKRSIKIDVAGSRGRTEMVEVSSPYSMPTLLELKDEDCLSIEFGTHRKKWKNPNLLSFNPQGTGNYYILAWRNTDYPVGKRTE